MTNEQLSDIARAAFMRHNGKPYPWEGAQSWVLAAMRDAVAAQAQPTIKESLTVEQPASGADGAQVDINDVRQYLDSWGCMAHPGVRAVVDAYQPQPSGNAGEDERAAFESAFKSEFIFDRSSWSSKGYAVPSTQSAWEGWQARAALAAQASGQDREDAVAEVSQETFNSDGTSDIIKPALPIGMKLYARPASKVKA